MPTKRTVAPPPPRQAPPSIRVHSVVGPPIGGARPSHGTRRFVWLVLLPVCFLAYSVSFPDYPVLEARHSVLADADAANFALLLRDFSLSRKYGDEYVAVGRSLGDNAQKHKIHHVPYAIVGSQLHDVLRWGYARVGIPGHRALYSVNALIACLNLVLLALLLARFNPAGNPLLPFLLLYAGSLSTWIYGSIPESWPFTTTLVLAYFLLLGRYPLRPVAMGVGLGLVMLNNLFMSVLSILLVVGFARGGKRGRELVRSTALAGMATVGTWFASLSALALFDGSFRPDRFIRYTLWFRDFTTGNFLPPSDPYVWKSAGTNLLINSVVSNQPDPFVPQETLRLTLGSPLGAIAVAAYLAVVAVAALALYREFLRRRRQEGTVEALRDPALGFPLWCLVMVVLTAIVFYPSGFLYSTVVVPVIPVILCRYLELRITWQRVLLYAGIFVILTNNVSQILQFRTALATLS